MAFTGARLNPSEQPWDTTNYTHPSDPNLQELHRTIQYDAAGRPVLRTNNFLLDVSANRVPGHSIVFLTGRNRNVSINTEASIWGIGGLYPWSTWDAGPAVIHTASSSASDVGKSILITGLDSNYATQSEVIVLNGLTSVATTKQYLRFNSAVVISGTGPNVGTVTFRYATAGGTAVGMISPTHGLMHNSFYTVPAGYTAFSVYGDFSVSGGNTAELEVFWRFFGTSFVCVYSTIVTAASYKADPIYPGRIPEKTDLDNRVNYGTNNLAVTSNQQLLLIENTYL